MRDNGNRRLEQGSVLVFFAFAVLVLLGFVALSVGLYQATTTRETMRTVARMTALGSIEAYFASDATDEPDKRTDAEDRAKDLLAFQLNNNSSLLESGASSVSYAPPGVDVVPPNTLHIRGGNYYFVKPSAVGGPDPCSGNYPCFVRETSNTDTLNAFRIVGSFGETLWSNFSSFSFSNQGNFSVEVALTATTIPRTNCFIVDASGSMDYGTHPGRTIYDEMETPWKGHGTKAAFVLTRHLTGSDNPDLGSEKYTFDDLKRDSSDNPECPATPYNSQSSYFQNGEEHQMAPLLCHPNLQVRPADEFSRVRHFLDDYTKLRTLGDNDYSRIGAFFDAKAQKAHPDPSLAKYAAYRVGSHGLVHRVDTHRREPDLSSGDPGYNGPQPFGMVVEGLKTAVETFKSNAIAGDKICILFFDESVSWSRTIIPTDNYDYVLSLLDQTVPPTGYTDDAINASPPDNLDFGTGFKRMVRFGIFPHYEKRTDFDGDELRTEGFTNIPLALNATVDLIEDSAVSGVPTTSSITLMTDGITKCTLDGDCVDNYWKHKESIDETLKIVEDRLVPGNIPLHVVLLGDRVEPHTALMPDGSGACMTDNQARAMDIPYVIGGDAAGNPYTSDSDANFAYLNRSSTTPWWQVNSYFYTMATKTRGFWIPLRRSGTGCNVNHASSTCSTMSSIEDAVRWSEDPECRDTNTQIQDAIKKIVGDNPYSVVEIE